MINFVNQQVNNSIGFIFTDFNTDEFVFPFPLIIIKPNSNILVDEWFILSNICISLHLKLYVKSKPSMFISLKNFL